MTDASDDGWNSSAEAWLSEMGERGDYGREFVLDGPMLARIRGRDFRTALDVGCGEGRFCRMMRAEGIEPVGIDPTGVLLARARELDPQGDYRQERAESFAVEEGAFDLVVSYLSLIDIAELETATAMMVRALRPGGTLLIANLTSFSTSSVPNNWVIDREGQMRFVVDHYLTERPEWTSWRDMRIVNWHRPLSTYMRVFLSQGLVLTHFDEPAPTGGDPAKAERYRRVPWFHIMEWRKPD